MNLRNYQNDAVTKTVLTNIGQIILPTGSGKSVIQGEVICQRINNSKTKFGIYVICTPRIALTNQLMTDVTNHLALSNGLTLSALTVHSGNSAAMYSEDDNDYVKYVFSTMENKSTTDTDDIILKIKQTKKSKTPLLICCTYNSIPTLISALKQTKAKISQVLCDEAHYIVERRFFESVKNLKKYTKNIHFFTATQAKTDDKINGLGMDNENFYGKVIFRKTPREMIDNGWMIRPRLHWEKSLSETEDWEMIKDAFIHHQTNVNYNAKLLVCCDGSQSILDAINNKHFINWVEKEDITVFACASHCDIQFKIINSNGTINTDRNKFFKHLRSHKGKAIVMHINMLTEGIDVPDFSGVMFIRNMGLTRFLQSVGRATRVHNDDKGKDVANFEHWTKPYAWIIIAERDGESDKTAALENFVWKMREAGFEASETVGSAYDKGTNDEVTFDLTNLYNNKWNNSTFHKMFTIQHTLELDRIASLPTIKEQLNNIEF